MVARRVAGLIAAGAAAKVVLAFVTVGQQFDIDSLALVGAVLRTPERWHLYEIGARWPYPAGFFPLDYLAGSLAYRTGLPFHGTIQLWTIAADSAMAWLVQDELRRRGSGDRARLIATALIAFGPVFVLIDGYHGQIDSVPTLFALGAALVVVRGGPAWAAGLLLGVAVSMKTAPVLLLLVLLPALGTWRSRAWLAVPTLALPVLVTLPWLITDFDATWAALTANQGVPSVGGYSVLLEPSLTGAFLFGDRLEPGSVVTWFTDHQNLIVGVVAVVAAVVAHRRRLGIPAAASLLYLGVWAANPNQAYQYYVWGIPFLLLAGHWRGVLALQAALAVPALIVYPRWNESWLQPPYVVMLVGIWLATVVWFAVSARSA